jgi:hypothetical protein
VYGVRYVGGRWEEIMALVTRFQGWLVGAVVLLVAAAWSIGRWRRAKAARPAP